MVVPKADKIVRICEDYKSAINQSVEDEEYVPPTAQDLYTALVGSKIILANLICHMLMPN